MKSVGLNEQQLQKNEVTSRLHCRAGSKRWQYAESAGPIRNQRGAWSNEDEMFAIVHQMRTRMITTHAFNGERIIGAILFENTMDRDINGQPTANYLWNVKRCGAVPKSGQGPRY
jgi:Fructose-1,6-bisphosphate aldolase